MAEGGAAAPATAALEVRFVRRRGKKRAVVPRCGVKKDGRGKEKNKKKRRITAGGCEMLKWRLARPPQISLIVIKHRALHFNGDTCGWKRPDKVPL